MRAATSSAEIASFRRVKITAVDDTSASSQTPTGPSPAQCAEPQVAAASAPRSRSDQNERTTDCATARRCLKRLCWPVRNRRRTLPIRGNELGSRESIASEEQWF